MKRFDPDKFRVGEILLDWVEHSQKQKLQLCVRSRTTRRDFRFVFINTGTENCRKGRFVVDYKRLLLPRPRTGYTEFDLSYVRTVDPKTIRPNAIVYPSIGRKLANELANFAETEVRTLSKREKTEMVEALRSITAPDPTPEMRRQFRGHIYRG